MNLMLLMFHPLLGGIVLNASFTNISVISWRSVLLEKETEYLEKTTDLSQVIDTLYHIMLYLGHLAWTGFELTTLVVLGTDCIVSCKSNYAITTTKVPPSIICPYDNFFSWNSFCDISSVRTNFTGNFIHCGLILHQDWFLSYTYIWTVIPKPMWYVFSSYVFHV